MTRKDKDAQRKYQREYMKKWRAAHPEAVTKDNENTKAKRRTEFDYKAWYQQKITDPCFIADRKQYYQDNKEYFKQKSRECYARTREKVAAKAADRRLQCLHHYSGNPPKCACCGESTVQFLAIDHIDGGGLAHRKQIKTMTIFHWLIKNNFPDGFQVLCHNCNMAKSCYGRCPHNDRTE